jgi:hypothetical protein
MDVRITIADIPPPELKKRLSTAEILLGPPLDPLTRLRNFSDEDFEKVVFDWAYGFLAPRYVQVKRLGGAGDKGRDIIAYYVDDRIDIFQCKHYDHPISPVDIYVELGKLCYYTFARHFRVPDSYTIVSSQGLGPKLFDMTKNPTQLRAALVDHWEGYCESKITGKERVRLDGEFKEYVEQFDFSIVKELTPSDLIDQHSKTAYHAIRFGGGLKKYRQYIPEAPSAVQSKELNYITQLLEVYSEKTGREMTIVDLEFLKTMDLIDHYNEQRNSFYCAESLEIFSRENFPDSEPLPFIELKNESYSIISNMLLIMEKDPAFARLVSSVQEVLRSSFSSNPLSLNQELKALDKKGICHYLANENKVKWRKHN